jgi:serine/threonine protein kinase
MDPLGPVADTQVGADTPALTFGPYRLVQRLGAGGMGEVWLAEQVAPIRRHVALKVIKAGMDTAQGRPYFAMEYVNRSGKLAEAPAGSGVSTTP